MAFVDLCRLCGTDTLNVVRNAIFEGEGRAKKYALKISECLTLQVTKEDPLPKIMCGECSYKLDLISDFRDKAHKTATELLSKVDFVKVKAELQDIDEDKSSVLDSGDNTTSASSPRPQPELDEVQINEEDVESLAKKRPATKRFFGESEQEEEEGPAKKRSRTPFHAAAPSGSHPSRADSWGADDAARLVLPLVHSDESPSYDCQLCSERFKNADFLKSHAENHLTSNPGEIKCAFDECRRIFFSSEELKEHRQQHTQAPNFSCVDCSRSYHHKFDLDVHARRHSEKPEILLLPYACKVPGCSYSGRVVQQLLKHKKNVHSSTIYTCVLCGWCHKKFKHFNVHMARHNTDTPGVFRCVVDNCEKLFENGDSLKAHIKEMHDIVPEELRFKCNIQGCKYSAIKITGLQTHKNLMHTFNLFKCCLCGKMANCFVSFKRHLQRHKMIHPGGVLKCLKSDCTETFNSPIDLLEHVEAHEGVRRYECQECGHLAESKMQMREHVSQH